MSSTYTSPLGINKPGLNDYFNAWHTPANLNYDMLADAIGGVTPLTLTGDQTLSITDGADSDGRAAILTITSSDQHDRVSTVPAVSKTYVVRNASSYRVKIKPTAGTATDVMLGQSALILVTTTHCYRIATSGWGLHSTVTTTSGTTATFTFTGLGQHFNDALFVFDATASAAGNLTVQPRTDAASGGTAFDTGILMSTAQMGALELNNYRASVGSFDLRSGASAASPSTVTASSGVAVGWRVTGGIGSVVFSLTGGNSFNAGSISCYLR